MAWFHVEFRLVFEDFSDDELSDIFDTVADCMADMDGMDADADLNLGERVVGMSMSLERDAAEDAVRDALAAARAAVHASGGSTPGWEKMIAEQAMEMRMSTGMVSA